MRLLPSLPNLAPAHRKLVAEIVLVRLFFMVENAMASAGAKVLCGAPYLDGTAALRLVTPRSLAAARVEMQTHGRSRQWTLSWSKSSDIRENLKYTLDAHDPFLSTVVRHAWLLTEMRYVRNHAAHHNAGTRTNFRKVIKKYYGGFRKGVTPGLLLLTLAHGTPCLLEKYIISSRVLVKELVRA